MADEAPATPEPVDEGESALAAAIAAADAPESQTLDTQPDWVQKIVRDARAEAAQYRTTAKTAAQAAQQELTDKMAALLGLKPELDPETLAASLKQSQSEAQARARELAVYKAAVASGANVDRLMDSRSVMDSVADIDPTDIAAITAAITAATTANPYLKATQAAASSGAPLSGTHEDGQMTEAQFAAIANDPAAVLAAYDAGKLDRIRGAI